MSNWTDVASKALDFLQKPSGLGVVVILSTFVFLVYAIPMGVVTWTSWDNTNRLEKANLANTSRLEKAIIRLGDNCMHSLASRPDSKKSETE